MHILWLKTGPLHPLDSGGKLRTYNMLRELHRKHQITYLSHFPVGTDESAQTLADEYSGHHIWVRWRETSKRSCGRRSPCSPSPSRARSRTRA